MGVTFMDYKIEIDFFGLTLTASSNQFYKLVEIQEFVETMQEDKDELVIFEFDAEDGVEYDDEGYAWWYDEEEDIYYVYDEDADEWVEFEDDESEEDAE